MRTRTLLLWSAAATAVLVGLVAVLLTLPVDPAKAHHIPEDIDLTEAPHNLSLIGQKGTHGFWGTPTTEDNRYVDKSIGPYQEDKKTMRQCGCALAALAT